MTWLTEFFYEYINNIAIGLLSGLIGALLATIYGHLLSKKRWLNELKYDLYRELITYTHKFEKECFNEALQDIEDVDVLGIENIFVIPGSGIKITSETHWELFSLQTRADDLFKNAAICLKDMFTINPNKDIMEYIHYKHKAFNRITSEIGLPKKTAHLPFISDELTKHYNEVKNRKKTE